MQRLYFTMLEISCDGGLMQNQHLKAERVIKIPITAILQVEKTKPG